MNVLLTSVGRRSYLVNYFKEALADKGVVIGANMFANAAGMVAADIAVVVPPANSPEYVPFLEDLCRKYEIGLLCALHDLDVYMLSQNQQWLQEAGIVHTLPTAEWGRITLDKYECTRVLESHGIPVPKTSVDIEDVLGKLRSGEWRFPLVVKARAGFGSLGLAICHDEAGLQATYRNAAAQALASGGNSYLPLPEEELVLIQEHIPGREVCLGIVNDLKGDYRAHFACEVQAMRAGESDWAMSLEREPYANMARGFSKLTAHRGIWGVDCLDDNGTLRVIDVNPRFTGDYPFHHLAGASIPEALVAWASSGEPASCCFDATPGITAFKDLVPTKA